MPRNQAAEAAQDQIDLFNEIPAPVEAAPRERPAVILENWVRQGSFVVEEVEVQADGETRTQKELRIEGVDGPEPTEVPLRHIPRVMALCEIRDATRRLLHAELANAPKSQQDELRQKLNELYDDFYRTYGPINLESANATRNRRPNLKYFEDDPDAPLVAALEVVDLENQTYDKAPIFVRGVVRMSEAPVSAESAADALAISLDRRGKVDLDYMAGLVGKSVGDVVDELAGKIFLNPESNQWETAEEYLSGSVRSKLRVAKRAAETDRRWLSNVKALEAVQPEDLTEKEIEPSLGAPWIPASDIRDFIADMLRVPPDRIEVAVDPHQATWRVRADTRVKRSTLATRTWGTNRMNTIDLMDAILNQRDPVVHDPIPGTLPTKYTVNHDQTLSAREKAAEIKEHFKNWVWQDNTRTTRLVTEYNERYNDRIERTYDGSHLTFPGMSAALTLRPHQSNGIWRSIASGNTLLAHEVGAGKTYCEAGIAVESRRLGLAQKPCLIVPNHMIEQVSRDFLQMYPTAKVLIATKDDMKPQERKEFVAKIATSDVDCVIMTHNSFLKIPMSPAFERQLIEEEIRVLEQPMEDEDDLSRRARDRQIARWRKKLEELGEREDQDQGVTFEETGIDLVIVDEAHYFKGLPIDSKNRNRTQEESKRASDLYLRTRYINHMTPGRGVVFATGTPITNTIAEVYVMQTYLQRDRLIETGLAHFDAWAAQFGETVTQFELAPGGGYRLNSRFAKFKNVPELTAMFREVADVQLAEDLDLPVPKVKGGEPTIVVVQPTPEQERAIEDCIERAGEIAAKRVRRNQDNMLKVVGDGRKVALDIRLVDPTGQDHPENKISVAARLLAEKWHQTLEERATQLVFCDMGTPANSDFSAYVVLREKLIDLGVAPEEIAFMQDAKSDKAKHRLQKAVRDGHIRILIASTDTAGVGTNVQDRLCRIMHLDIPWRPCDMTQRNGRGIRQGNRHEEIEILILLTERSFDAYIAQGNERKSRFINQMLKGDPTLRSMEDVSEVTMSYATMKAVASGNPLVREKAELENEVVRVQKLIKNERNQRWTARRDLAMIPDRLDRLQKMVEYAAEDAATMVDISGDNFRYESSEGIVIENPKTEPKPKKAKKGEAQDAEFGDLLVAEDAEEVVEEKAEKKEKPKRNAREVAGDLLLRDLRSADARALHEGSAIVYAGKLGGFELYFDKVHKMSTKLLAKGRGKYEVDIPFELHSAMGMIRRAENLVSCMDEQLKRLEGEKARLQQEEEGLIKFINSPSELEGRLDQLVTRLEEVDRELGIAAVNEMEGDEQDAPNQPRMQEPDRPAPAPQPAPQPAVAPAPQPNRAARAQGRLNEAPAQPAPAPQPVAQPAPAPAPALAPEAPVNNAAREAARERARRALEFARNLINGPRQ